MKSVKCKADLLVGRDLLGAWSNLWIWQSVVHWRTVNFGSIWRSIDDPQLRRGGTQGSRTSGAEIRRAVDRPGMDLCSLDTEELRVFAGHYWWSCGPILKHLLAVFYLLLQNSEFRFLVLLFCLQHSEKLGDPLVDCIRRLGDFHILWSSWI